MNTFAASPLFPFAASRRRRSPEQLLGFRPTSRRVIAARVSVPGGEVAPPSPSPTVTPLYNPTPPDRALRTPHSGYYFDGSARLFFEGWYLKVSIRECRETFCFMYSVENPAFPNGMSALDKAIHGPRFTGVGAQILGAHDKYICRHELMLGNAFVPGRDSSPPDKEVPPQEFSKHVLEGFQVSPFWHQGFIRDDGRWSWRPRQRSRTHH